MGWVMEIILGVYDFDVDLVEWYGSINWVLDLNEIGLFVEELVNCIVKFFVGFIIVCKRSVLVVVEILIEEGLKIEVY